MQNLSSSIANSRGSVFITTVIVAFLMTLVGASLFQMITQDSYYTSRLKRYAQSQYIAEAGLADAIAVLDVNFNNKDSPGNFPLNNFANGTYDVTVTQQSGRVLLTSVGTIQGVSSTVSAEVQYLGPTALNYAYASGGDIRLWSAIAGVNITGNMHSNANTTLRAQTPFGSITITGNVSAGGTVSIFETFGGDVTVTGTITSAAGLVTLPTFDFSYYQAIATANGQYFSGNKTYSNVNLTPPGGIIYVNGNVTFPFGTTSTLTGCIVSTGVIQISGRLTQTQVGNLPALMTTNNDIRLLSVLSRLTAQGLIYSGDDFQMIGAGSILTLTGTLVTLDDIDQNDIISRFTFTYAQQNPPGLIIPGGSSTWVDVVSYNK